MRLLSALLAITARAALDVGAGEEQVPLTSNTDYFDTPLNVAIIGKMKPSSSSIFLKKKRKEKKIEGFP